MAPSAGDEVRQRLTAILFADVVNYSGAMERDQVGTHRRVKRRVNLFRSLIADYDGHIFDIEGDAVKAAFDSAFQAVRFAVDLQREFRNDAVWNSDPTEPVFRIGINLGEVIVEPDGYYGHEVNVAERLQALAVPGGICVSDAVHRMVRGKLPVNISPIGRQSLKNMIEPVEAYAIDLQSVAVPPPPMTPVPRGSPILAPGEQAASVVVLPLRNLTGNLGDDHLCDGIISDIITNLSRFREILVIARHSAFFFRDVPDDLRDVGGLLGVRYALTGALQRAEQRISITVQLLETETGRIVWSDRYKGDLRDIFDFQDEITGVIAARCASQVTVAELRRVASLQPADLRAYGLVLRGHEFSLQYRKDANLHARRLFEEATETDPSFARSYAGMSKTFNHAWRYRWIDSPEAALDKAVELALEAIRRDGLDARGHSELGYACLYKRQHDSSISAFERAIQLNPNEADILAEMGDSLTASGNAERAIEVLNRAMRLNPLFPDWYLWNLGEAYFNLSRFDEAIAIFNRMHDPSEAHRLLAASHAWLNQLEQARHHASQVLAVHPDFSLEHWRSVLPYRNPEQFERLIGGMRLAGLN